MSICATIGRPIICSAEACIHDGFVWFKELDERLSVEFMFYFLLMNEEFIGRQRQMGTQGNLNTDIVKKTWVPVPPRHAEQQNIVNACVVADEAVDKESRYLTKLMNLKQGLMEDLLTGRVRVTGLPKDIEKMLDEIAGKN
jgi:type I restriction enzyme S subunit